MSGSHIPVLLQEVLMYLKPTDASRYVDATAGGGGHTAALLAASAPSGKVLAIDRDPTVLARLKERFGQTGGRLVLATGTYEELPAFLGDLGWPTVNGILLDLGLSSLQLDDPARGFSFRSDAPLDLRFDQTTGESAAELLEKISMRKLAEILREFGDLTDGERIAQRILVVQRREPITRTTQLAQASGLHHPTRLAQLFQALRIATNQELDILDRALPKLFACLAAGGRLAVISFHSGEDRPIKQTFATWAKTGKAKILTKKPIEASGEEQRVNPRSRSAKLRVIEKE